MRNFRWLTLLMVLCLLCALIPVCLSEEDAVVQAAENPGAALWPEEDAAELPGDYALFESEEAEAPDGAGQTELIPNAGGAEVPLKDYNFPDASFRAYLEKNIDKDGNQYLSDQEINSAASLDLHGLNITDLKGIEFFPTLKQLDCSDCLLSGVDLRGNPELLSLNCSGNRLEYLDVSNCQRLAVLHCERNKLTSVSFPEVSSLMQLHCQNNSFTTLSLNCLDPDGQYMVAQGVAATDIPGRPGSGGFTTIGAADYSLTCDDYIELTLNGKVLRTLTAKSIDFEAKGVEIEVGQTSAIVPVFRPAKAVVPLYYVMSGDAGVITLYDDGRIVGLKPGNAKIFIYSHKNFSNASFLLTFNVTVVRPKPIGIKFLYSNLGLGLGETLPLETVLEPEDALTALTFNSKDPKIASLIRSDDGKMYVKGKKKGTTTITVTTSNNKTDTCTVTVKAAPEKIELDHSGTVKLGLGNGLFLHVTVEPKNSSSTLTWTSSNPKVATVVRGTVNAKSKGTTTITVKTFNGIKDSVKIKVIDPVPTEITLNKKVSKLNVGDTLRLTATVKPDNAKDKTVSWSTSDKKVATVTKNGLVVAKKKGTATITAKTSNGIKAKCKITVVIPEPTSIQIVKTKTTVKVKKTLKLKTVLSPAHAESKLTWSSSNTSIATVNKKGEVKGKKKGTVTITVKTANGKKDSIQITVN